MEANRLKQLRKKQMLFLNGVLVLALLVLFGVIVGVEPSATDVYRVLSVLMIGFVLIELFSMLWPERFKFFAGPSFMQELLAYEREKLGKQQDNKARIIRVGLQLFLASQFLVYSVTRANKPMVIDDMAAFLKFYIPVNLVILLVLNLSILYRSYSIDHAGSDQLRWHTLQMLVAGVVLGVLMLVGVGLVVVLLRL
jgi:hypothetical protein